MEQAILIYVLLAVVIVLPFVGRILKRRARAAGERRWEGRKDRQAADDGLGATVILHCDRQTAEQVVAPILEAAKRVRRQVDGTWAQTHYNDDDIVYELTPVAGGTLIGVSRAIEFASTLNGMKAWARLREAIVAEASQRGIPTTLGARPLVRAGTEVAGAAVWVPGA